MTLEEAVELAWEKMDQHGLTDKGWTVAYDERWRLLGHCSHSHKTITLSLLHIEQHSREEVLDTILHEIAHALVGPGHDHDYVWQLKAILLGATPSPTANCSICRKPQAKQLPR